MAPDPTRTSSLSGLICPLGDNTAKPATRPVLRISGCSPLLPSLRTIVFVELALVASFSAGPAVLMQRSATGRSCEGRPYEAVNGQLGKYAARVPGSVLLRSIASWSESAEALCTDNLANLYIESALGYSGYVSSVRMVFASQPRRLDHTELPDIPTSTPSWGPSTASPVRRKGRLESSVVR